jgi:hypothetical protein
MYKIEHNINHFGKILVAIAAHYMSYNGYLEKTQLVICIQ